MAPAESLRLGYQWKDIVAEDREWQMMTPTDDVARESVERLEWNSIVTSEMSRLAAETGRLGRERLKEKEEGRMKLGATEIVSVQARPPKERAQPISDEEKSFVGANYLLATK